MIVKYFIVFYCLLLFFMDTPPLQPREGIPVWNVKKKPQYRGKLFKMGIKG